MATNQSFRNKFAFGKRIEAYVEGMMLKQGLDIYTPEVDNDAVDIVVKSPQGYYVEVQVKAVSKGTQFAGISHQPRKNYWFVFYSESMDTFWLFSSSDFLKEACANKAGTNIGKYSIKLDGIRKGVHYSLPKYQKYIFHCFIYLITRQRYNKKHFQMLLLNKKNIFTFYYCTIGRWTFPRNSSGPNRG